MPTEAVIQESSEPIATNVPAAATVQQRTVRGSSSKVGPVAMTSGLFCVAVPTGGGAGRSVHSEPSKYRCKVGSFGSGYQPGLLLAMELLIHGNVINRYRNTKNLFTFRISVS